MEEYRYYFDENGDFIGGIFDTDPVPTGWVTYTLIVPPSLDGPSIDYPNGPFGVPGPIEKWSFVDSNWYVPFTTNRLRTYRNNKTNVIVESGVFDIQNDSESYTALCRICQGIPIENSDPGVVMWKNLDGEYQEAGYDDMQNLFKACYQREQLCRTAESVVLSNHAITPYVDFADATTDFDNAL